MPSTWWSVACLACLSTCVWGKNSPSVKWFETLQPATLFQCYFVYHAFIVDAPWCSHCDVKIS